MYESWLCGLASLCIVQLLQLQIKALQGNPHLVPLDSTLFLYRNHTICLSPPNPVLFLVFGECYRRSEAGCSDRRHPLQ